MRQERQLILTVKLRAVAGKAAELETVLRNRVPISRTEAGTLDYRLYRHTSDDHVFFLFARFASEKAFDLHLYSPYILSMLAEYDTLLAEPTVIDTYESVLG
jgi:quinol monooxygenase YgiN